MHNATGQTPSLDVLEPQMGNQLVEVLQKIDTRTLRQVIEVPKIFPVSVPQRLGRVVLCRWQNSWWKCRQSQCTFLWFSPRRSIRGESFLALSQDRVQQRLGPGWRRSLTIQFLRVGGDVVEVFKVYYAMDKIQQQWTWSRSLIFQLVAVFTVSPQARDQVADIPVVAQMQIPLV